ncbi:MAG TPA: hypothetical protein VF682_23845 [Pseudomonas sp.]
MTNEEFLQATSHLIGTRYVAAVKTYITELTGRTRVSGPNEITTKEFDLSRVTVVTDGAGIITQFHFG